MRAIDADKLKEHIDKLPALPDGNFAGNHSALKALINMQPSVEPERKRSGWIPVTKCLPEETVLVCMKDGGIFIGNLATVSGKREWHDDGWEHTYELDEIIAWMPLPDPYDGEVD